MKQAQFTGGASVAAPRSHSPHRNSRQFRYSLRRCVSALVCVLAGAALTAILSAQLTAEQALAVPMDARLPAATQSYLHWRGTKTIDPAKTKNRLLQLWADPDFAPVRRSLLKQAYTSAWRAPYSGPATADQIDSLSPLFENESIAGSMAPALGKTGSANAEGDSFVVYDATGQENLVQKAIELMQKSAPGAPKVSSYAFGETRVESIQTGAGSLYWARTGSYFIRASRKELEEDLIARFRSKAPVASSLGDDADWKRAKEHFLPGATLDVFVRTGKQPAASPSGGTEFNRSKFEAAEHLDRAHALALSVSLAGEATRVRAVMLADTAAGSLFDIAGASGTEFETLPLARDGASYNVVRLNLPAIYQIFHGAVLDSLPAKQANTLKGFDILGAAMLGMPIPDALALFGGEMAAITSAPDDPTYSDLYAATIRKPDEVLGLLRKTLGTMIEHEDHSDGITFLELSSKSVDPQTKAPRSRYYYVAVTPRMVLVSQRKTMVRDAAARLTAASTHALAAALASNPDFVHIRALLPKNLSGLTYTQMSKLTWERDLSVMVKSAGKAAQAGSGTPGSATEDPLQGVNLSVFARHLHSYAGGWWKAADGIYFDSYLQ